MEILANNLKRQYDLYAKEYEEKALAVLRKGWYVLGTEVSSFEQEFADYVGAKYCVGLASGLDALWIGLKAMGIKEGDEVIVAANAYIACVMSITMNGATPIFVEPDEYDNLDANKVEEKITPSTKAIMAVHLYGQSCDMDQLMKLSQKYSIPIIEDCAQAHGTKFNGKTCGTFGKVGCFSFYPTKGLGAFGDGGAIVTDDAELADYVRMYRNYGSKVRYENEVVGANSRLDEIQAGLLRVKLKHLDTLNEERNQLAKRYLEGIQNPLITCLQTRPHCYNTYHQFEIHCPKRDALITYLKDLGIGTIIHYPIPPYLSKAYAYLGYQVGDFPITEQYANEILSIPMYNGMTQEEQDYVINAINAFE
ncbi:MAG: DegT/DnrJ/EryC1/StrS family aminotransferase [Solobacterium sp.]|nr:DegT/DnrJ/EryC1/StrS family aminotransferase [Solobacterium sp.]